MGGELSLSGGLAEMIGNSCPDANAEILIKRVGNRPEPPANSYLYVSESFCAG
jgi:hypothetical protein